VCTQQISTEYADTDDAYQNTAPSSPVAAVTDTDVTETDVTESDALAAKLQAAEVAQSDDDVTDANEEPVTAVAQQ
jgi:hypothetical protein